MCRSHRQGHRRCVSDSSALRQERRISQKLRVELTNSLHKTIKPAEKAKTSDKLKSINEIKEAISNIREVIKSFNPLDDSVLKEVKDKVIVIGESISAIAFNNLGLSENELFEIEKSEALKIQDEYENAKKSYASKSLELSKKYNIMNMDVPYNLSLMMDRGTSSEHPDLTLDYSDIKASKEKADELYASLREAKSKGSKAANDLRAKAQQEYLKILNEVRELGGNVKVHPNSNKAQVQILNEVSAVFPQDWITKSNLDGENLLIKKTRARAHYTESATQKTYKLFDSGYIKTLDSDKRPDGTRWESGWIELDIRDGGEAVYTDSSGVEHYYYVNEGEKAYYVPSWEYYSPYYNSFDNTKGKPKGNGWEEVTVKDSNWDRETNQKTYTDTKTWRRVKKERRAVGFSSTAELLIDGSKDTAMHEFMHRIESKNPMIGKMEEAFIKDRTTDDSGLREPFIKLYGRSKEISRPDNFVSDYMGKHYNDSKHWEVLSTGVEAVFGTAYGGLLGVSDFKKDLEHRDFVLGVFATI
jgi:DNA-binding protein H-NS